MRLLLPLLVLIVMISGMIFPTFADPSENPVVTWNKLTGQLGSLYNHGPPALARDYVLVHVAIYDALLNAVNNNENPSEAAIVAGAASEVLKHLFPANAGQVDAIKSSQIASIGDSPSRVQLGLDLGHIVGKKVVDYAKTDGYDTPWDGSRPPGGCIWPDDNPIGATFGNVKTFILTSWDKFTIPPPPDCGSAEDADEIQLVIDTQNIPQPQKGINDAIAVKWEPIPALIHNKQLNERIESHNLDIFDAARAAVYTNIASHDAMVAVWHNKYDYWTARPFHRIDNFVPVIVTPNFPGYPSGHSTAAPATALVLGNLFGGTDQLLDDAAENAKSRLYGGVHFNIDDDVGYDLGIKIGRNVLNDMLGSPHPFIYDQHVIGGKIIPIEITALLLAGAQTSAAWMAPLLFALVGTAIIYIKKKRN